MDRADVGRCGEEVAVGVLGSHGLVVTQRNRHVGRGELDAIGRIGRGRVAVEVRTVRGELDLDLMFPPAKRRQVSALARAVGIRRVDLVGVGFDTRGIVIHWLRDVPAE